MRSVDHHHAWLPIPWPVQDGVAQHTQKQGRHTRISRQPRGQSRVWTECASLRSRISATLPPELRPLYLPRNALPDACNLTKWRAMRRRARAQPFLSPICMPRGPRCATRDLEPRGSRWLHSSLRWLLWLFASRRTDHRLVGNGCASERVGLGRNGRTFCTLSILACSTVDERVGCRRRASQSRSTRSRCRLARIPTPCSHVPAALPTLSPKEPVVSRGTVKIDFSPFALPFGLEHAQG